MALKVVITTTYGATSDNKVVKLKTFYFQPISLILWVVMMPTLLSWWQWRLPSWQPPEPKLTLWQLCFLWYLVRHSDDFLNLEYRFWQFVLKKNESSSYDSYEFIFIAWNTQRPGQNGSNVGQILNYDFSNKLTSISQSHKANCHFLFFLFEIYWQVNSVTIEAISSYQH